MAQSKAKVEAEIEARRQAMLLQIEALGSDLNAAGESVKDAVLNNPFVKAGGALLAGLLVGLLLGKRRSGSGEAVPSVALRQLSEAGVDDEMVERLRKRGTLVVMGSPSEKSKKSGFLRSASGILVSLALREVVRRVMDRVDIEEALGLDDLDPDHGDAANL